MVSVLAFFSDDPSSNPSEVYNFSVKLLLKRTKINRGWRWPIKNYIPALLALVLYGCLGLLMMSEREKTREAFSLFFIRFDLVVICAKWQLSPELNGTDISNDNGNDRGNLIECK